MNKDKTKHNCSNCSAFGKHCPHKVNGDPYHYDCGMTVEDLEKENAELKSGCGMCYRKDKEQLTKAKEIIKKFLLWENDWHNKTESKYELLKESEQFISEVEK